MDKKSTKVFASVKQLPLSLTHQQRNTATASSLIFKLLNKFLAYRA
jgi:hypothetical protein